MPEQASVAPLLTWQGEVLPAWVDYNGHLNDAYYLVIFSFATDRFMDRIGLDAAGRAATGCGGLKSVGFDAVVANHFGPNVNLLVDECFGFVHAAPRNFNALSAQPLRDLWVLQNLVQLIVHALDDFRRRLGGSQQSPPRRRFKTRKSSLGNGGDIWKFWNPFQ